MNLKKWRNASAHFRLTVGPPLDTCISIYYYFCVAERHKWQVVVIIIVQIQIFLSFFQFFFVDLDLVLFVGECLEAMTFGFATELWERFGVVLWKVEKAGRGKKGVLLKLKEEVLSGNNCSCRRELLHCQCCCSIVLLFFFFYRSYRINKLLIRKMIRTYYLSHCFYHIV